MAGRVNFQFNRPVAHPEWFCKAKLYRRTCWIRQTFCLTAQQKSYAAIPALKS